MRVVQVHLHIGRRIWSDAYASRASRNLRNHLRMGFLVQRPASPPVADAPAAAALHQLTARKCPPTVPPSRPQGNPAAGGARRLTKRAARRLRDLARREQLAPGPSGRVGEGACFLWSVVRWSCRGSRVGGAPLWRRGSGSSRGQCWVDACSGAGAGRVGGCVRFGRSGWFGRHTFALKSPPRGRPVEWWALGLSLGVSCRV